MLFPVHDPLLLRTSIVADGRTTLITVTVTVTVSVAEPPGPVQVTLYIFELIPEGAVTVSCVPEVAPVGVTTNSVPTQLVAFVELQRTSMSTVPETVS